MANKNIVYLILVISLILVSCEEDTSNIQFRIKNNLGEPISRCYLGSFIRKDYNSYASKSYRVRWNELADGELTVYKKVKGKFLGYSDCDLEFFGKNSRYPHQTRLGAIEKIVKDINLNLVKDSVIHPFDNVFMYDNRLPDGKYTMTIEGFDSTVAQTIIVSVVKDE